MNVRYAKSRSPRHRSGMAMMLVIPAVALAAVLAYAVLASTGTQEQISANAALIAQADCLAESGINYAVYNLQNPANAPALWLNQNIPVSTGGSFTANVTPVIPSTIDECAITSTGTINGVSRTEVVMVSINSPVVSGNQAAGFNSPALTVSGTVTGSGSIVTGGSLSVSLGSSLSITGTVQATSLSGLVSDTSTLLSGSTSAAIVPTTANSFTSYYLGGVLYYATNLATDPVAGTVLGPTSSNPAGVYYSTNANRTLAGVTINGTLIVTGNGSTTGGVIVQTATTNSITPIPGFPAIIVDNTIKTNGNNSNITLNGVVMAKKGITQTSALNTGSTITVNGTLMIPSTSSTAISNYKQNLGLNFAAANVNVPNFSSQSSTPTMQIVKWTQP